jgi:hypothetical protein
LRQNRPRPLSDFTSGVTKNILGKKGMLFGRMVAEWAHIVGSDTAAKSIPLDLKYTKKQNQQSEAVLHLAVQSAFALELSYEKGLLIQRLNEFFGYPAIRDIKFIQQTNVMGRKAGSLVAMRPLTLQEQQSLDGIVEKIEENGLQTALKNLGKAMLSRRQENS